VKKMLTLLATVALITVAIIASTVSEAEARSRRRHVEYRQMPGFTFNLGSGFYLNVPIHRGGMSFGYYNNNHGWNHRDHNDYGRRGERRMHGGWEYRGHHGYRWR
jgi:hypothetical protein